MLEMVAIRYCRKTKKFVPVYVYVAPDGELKIKVREFGTRKLN